MVVTYGVPCEAVEALDSKGAGNSLKTVKKGVPYSTRERFRGSFPSFNSTPTIEFSGCEPVGFSKSFNRFPFLQ